jgi:hypothetical protein|tara:strand:+ start:277 stop:666 length:390 start_codon:yes stop_codon:yes gene_type:complete
MKHLATVLNQTLKFNNETIFKSDLVAREGKLVVISIDNYKTKRSLDLNKYYWGVVVRLLSDFTGFDKDDMHEVLKRKFLFAKKKINDEWVEYTLSTTKLSNTDMVEFIENVKRWAAEHLDVYIPDPNEI